MGGWLHLRNMCSSAITELEWLLARRRELDTQAKKASHCSGGHFFRTIRCGGESGALCHSSILAAGSCAEWGCQMLTPVHPAAPGHRQGLDTDRARLQPLEVGSSRAD